MALARNQHNLHTLQETHELCVRCKQCCRKHKEISYSLNNITHKCSEDTILIRRKGHDSPWRPVGPLPIYPRPPKYEVCWHYTEDRGCTRHGSKCTFARSSEEAALWNVMKDGGLTVFQIVHVVKKEQRTLQSRCQEKRGQFDCPLCHVHLKTHENFMNHCFTAKHRRQIFEDNSLTWQYRDPPPTSKGLKLCERSLMCEYGDNCTKAHSREELHEWQKRIKASRKNAREAASLGLLSYQDNLMDEYRHSNDKSMIISDALPDVSITCDPDSDSVYLRKKGIQYTWNFTISSKEPLEFIALLRWELGATFSLSEDPREERSYSTSTWFKNGQTEYEIPVTFRSDQPGLYEQWVVFDFNTRPVLRQKLKVRVGEEECTGTSVITPELEVPLKKPETARNLEPWNEKSMEIIPFVEREEPQRELLKRYQLVVNHQLNGLINRENYKQSMHSFLYQEEKTEAEQLSRLNLRATVKLKNQLSDDRFGMKWAYPGELFAAVPLSHPLTPDAPQGFIVKRHAIRTLVRIVNNNTYLGPIYEAEFLKDASTETKVHLSLSKHCCADLNLQNGERHEMEVQFQINRLWFCEMHKAIDNLPNLDKVLPDLKNRKLSISCQSDMGEFNEKQQAAMNFVLGVSDNRGSIPPLLIYGPFGTGKTQILAKMAQVLGKQPQNKILICTHTNSSADLYIKCHFHEYVTASHHNAKPLRIKAMERNITSTDFITLQYCHLSKDGKHFEFPERAILDSTRIVVTTTSLARFFHDMKLPENYFSHVLIDEASQMLECEALMALGLAGKSTRVVLAGDHMQMGPKLFSVGQDKCSEHTLLNRLFYHYQTENSDVAKQSRIIFHENYRSTKDIVDFVSTHFYVGKSDVIKAKGNVPSHPRQHALQFHHVRGECCLDPTSMSWFNPEQILSVVDILKDIMKEWPQEWGERDSEAVCVLSQGRQVLEVRQRLRRLGFRGFTVENAENVQGKQFRVIVISTVHTKDSLMETDRTCLEFFNDMRVLNTVMTRAQSQIFVVGDAAALSCDQFGMCWRLWRSYIETCIKLESAQGFTLESLKQDLLEISERRSEEEESSDSESTISEMPDTEDPILQELLDENKDITVDLTEEGLFPVFSYEHLVSSVGNQSTKVDAEQLWSNSSVYKDCELVKETFDRGYAKLLDESGVRIKIRGRGNFGQGFPGDKVKVEILSEESDPPLGRVIDILQKAETEKEFVCTLERFDSQVMTPINKCISKIYTPFWKDKPKHIAVRNPENSRVEFIKINEEARRKYLFVVRVLKWRKLSKYPLGIVVRVFPKIATLDDGLSILNTEFRLGRTLSSSLEKQMQDLMYPNVFEEGRRDFRQLQTFTVDPADSQDLDDAISVQDFGEVYEIGVHISDVASFVAKDSEMDKYARQLCTAFYPRGKEPIYMFPKELSANFFSLIPNHDRRAISLIIEVDAKTNHIIKKIICKSIIHSRKRFSYDEAEDVLENNRQPADPLEMCLVKVWQFAQDHRRYRKQEDWCYKMPDEDVTLGRRRSHQMVEELMVMYNHMVAEFLLLEETTRSKTPLRCQDRPKREKLIDLFDKNTALIPLSLHLSSQAQYVSPNPQADIADSGTFPILKSLLRCLKTAAKQENIYKIIDFVATDDIHPQLLPFAIAFRRLFQKACMLRSNSTHVSRIGHHDLDLDSYTWASSPVRRYIDVIVQRLLHSVMDETDVGYTALDINLLCMEFSRKNDQQSAYEKKANALHFALKISTQSERKVAYIVELNPLGTNFKVSFPLNRSSISENLDIMSRDLQLADQPVFDETNNCVILKWERRIYSFSNPHIHAEIKRQNPNSVMAYIPTNTWKCLADAVRDENWNVVFHLIEQLDAKSKTQPRLLQERLKNTKMSEKSVEQVEHYVELSLRIKQGEAVEVQLGAATARGLMTPAVHLFVVHPKFEICLEHVRDPIKCFSTYTFNSSRDSYNLYKEYQAIWKPMCEMESASNAVAENESILIEDVALKWETSPSKSLQGFFLLPLDKKTQWSIECDLRNSFLCIRTRIPQSQISPSLENSLMDIPSITWVVHAIITEVEETDSKEPKNLRIDFLINHMTMTNIPEAIFCERTRFTLELIPKLLPDVRKENAISRLTKANQLVKNIAMGRRINSEGGYKSVNQMSARFEIDNYLSSGISLNNSQRKAIREALTNPFTLIQGPPGTGKTVVGVHIVYWLHKNSVQLPPANSQKKRAILYCGPSNKSVDVVAGHLLKLREHLQPLRVYSDQIEMLEFPYPGCNLKLSRNSKRGEKLNTELSSIALHRLIREHGNPFATQICAFDLKIRRGDQLTGEEKKLYKEILQKARKHELQRHDVILCTCTAASHPALAEVLDFKQIIIDECAMATEPEAFIPLVAHKPEQIVLLGDHMQLQPVVHCEVVERLGMSRSLFERYTEKALLLDTQYRMQEDICAFPSEEFYAGQLKTGTRPKPSVFLTKSRNEPTCIVFGHVEGKEKSLVVRTEQGNENSKANLEEAEEVVRIAILLTEAGIQTKDIAVLTPYNAQVEQIKYSLINKGIFDITVNTIMRSQGSEWKYIIMSTVRSCPKSEIERQPAKSWIMRQLGFITDPHQVNVGITRAQEGLCIIGNENLLRCNFLWRKLLNHYQEKGCVVNPARHIQVQRPTRQHRNRRTARR